MKPIDNCGLHVDHFKGAINELKAANWYMERGYQVFLPIVQQGYVDFIAYKDGECERVQVKTATYIGSGGYQYLQCRTKAVHKYKYELEQVYDTLFIVYEDEYWRIPSMEIDSSNISLRTTNPNPRNEYVWDNYRVH